MADVRMPQLGETVTEGTITKWYKQVGDSVAADEALFEVSTDKVDTDVPSPVAGLITEIVAGEGATIPVGALIARVGDAAEVPAPAAPAAAPPTAAPAAAAPRAAAPEPRRAGDTSEPFNNIRRRTAEHMVMSKQTSPHVLTAVEVDFERVERVRRSHRESWQADEGFSLTYLPFIVRALCDALREYPHLNASVGEGALVVHNDINVAIAVDLNFE